MKKTLLTLLLAYTTTMCFGFNPQVRNFSKETYNGGSQTWAILQGTSGNMYFANNNGVLEFDGRSWRLQRLNNQTYARSLYLDDNSDIYVGGTNELGKLTSRRTGLEYTSLLDSLNTSVTEIWAIGRNADGRLQFQDQHALYTLGPEGIVRKETPSRQTGTIFCTAENDKYYAEGTTSNGVFIKNKENGRSLHLTTRNGLQNNTVLSMCFDSDGGLWLGLDKGIDYVVLSSPVYRLFGDPNTFGTGYAAVFHDRCLYLGTNTGVFCIEERDLYSSYDDTSFKKVDGIEGQVWDLQVIDGQLFCSQDKGLYIIDRGRVEKHIALPGCWRLEPLEEEHPTHMLGSTYEKMFTLVKREGTWEFDSYLKGFNEMGKSFFRCHDGWIWLGHHVKGLYRFRLGGDFSSVIKVEQVGTAQGFPENVGNYPFPYRGEVLFSTTRGIYRFDCFSDKASPLEEINRKFTPEERSTLMFYETPDGFLRFYWSGLTQAAEILTGEGQRHLDKYSFLHMAGKRPLGFSSYLTLQDDRLLINSEDGFLILDPHYLTGKNAEAGNDVYIKSITLHGSGQTVFASRANKPVEGTVKLGRNQTSFAVEAVSPSFSGTDAVWYSFFLDGADKEFSPFAPGGVRDYTHLKPGRYTLAVRSMNRHMAGRISETEIGIEVERAWFQSWWAICLYILLIVLLIAATLYLASGLAKIRADKLAARRIEEMQKAQIKKDLQTKADDLAASTMNLQRKNELLQKIGSKIDDAVESCKNGDPMETRLKRLRSISELIHENITHDTDWGKFQDNFDLVYDDFLKRLGAQFPALSMSDKRICAYLRMGLGSKDIAPLLGMTVRSVEMTRYRLRQKLGLSREHNLTDFLQRF